MSHVTNSDDSRFKHHLSFDNFAYEGPTNNSAISVTLTSKHTGYQYKKRSRTFMVGVDDHDYSKTALKWALTDLVDDGDEIVCVQVVEQTDMTGKMVNTKKLDRSVYQDKAQSLMGEIQVMNMNTSRQAVSIVLEYALGKAQDTFQKLVFADPSSKMAENADVLSLD